MQPQQPKEPRREIITWEEVDRLIEHLIPQFRREFTAMVIITRGGLIPGGMLGEAMDITHILTAAVDFPAQTASEKAKLIAWPSLSNFRRTTRCVAADAHRRRRLGVGTNDYGC